MTRGLIYFLALLLLITSPSSAFMPGVGVPNTRQGRAVSSNKHPFASSHTSYRNYGATKLSVAAAAGAASSVRNLAIAGRVPWKKLLITKAQARKVLSIMRAETHYLDLAMMLVLAIFPDHIGRFLYDGFLSRFRDNVEYNDSITSEVLETISEGSQLAVLCYLIDTIEVAMEVTGMKGNKTDVSTLIAKLIYATWACLRVRLYKRNFIEAFVDRTAPKKMMKGKQGIIEITDKFSDFFLFLVLALIWTDIIGIKSKGLSSIFALGGAGTFALTLASQDLVKKILNGLALTATDAFNVGDSILLGDGTSGIVTTIGWLNTEIRGTDELVTKIPNTQLSNIRITNRSRMKFSQVKQVLHFKYQDIDKIPDLMNEIKEEIIASCPKVVTDGSRVFRVRWTDYDHDHIKVLVDCRLRNPPTGEPYFAARQGVLEAVARAVRKNEIEFALPTVCEYKLTSSK